MNTLNSILKRIRIHAWRIIKHPAALLAKPLGYALLSKKQTVAYLSEFRVVTHPESQYILPEVRDIANPNKLIFSKNNVTSAPIHIWRYERGDKPTVLLPCGLLKIGKDVLNTDYWNYDALADVFLPRKRVQREVRVLLAPLGHYFDGDKFVGYYDFIFLIAAKLCRLKEAIPEEDFREAVVAYPLVNTSYERELLHLLGFGPDQIFDSRQTSIQAETTYLSSHDNWMHQNLADIVLLKKHLEPLIRTPRTGQNRIYISRAIRRRVVNEEALIAMLLKYDFTIIEDKPRTLVEQYAIYHNASFIIGPHGASFTNLLWCEPGTQLLELFTARFVPNPFLYLAEVLGLQYTAYCQGDNPRVKVRAIGDDVDVSIPDLERCLVELLPQKTLSAQY